MAFVNGNREQIDCLILLQNQETGDLSPILKEIYQAGTLLPTVMIHHGDPDLAPDDPAIAPNPEFLYHSAEVMLSAQKLEEVENSIRQALTQFLHLAPSCALRDKPQSQSPEPSPIEHQNFLLLQQRRLAEKLKERLGYLGVYYKRNPKYFYRNLPEGSRQETLKDFYTEYREILLNYFEPEYPINQVIDQFVNHAFFADLSVSQIVEIHMEIIDDFAQQLKLERRSEEILLDYRLTLIDVIAHLCEMYRRSIPREDLPFELVFQID